MVTRELVLQRFVNNGDASSGYLIEKEPNASFLGFTLEDEARTVKLAKETRIPAGRYRLTLNKQLTDKTEDYRKRYSWFKYHIMLNDVAGFTGIYIHIGNDDDDTDGCLLLGDQLHNIMIYKVKPLQRSTDCFKRFYEKYYPILEENTPVYITVIDEKY